MAFYSRPLASAPRPRIQGGFRWTRSAHSGSLDESKIGPIGRVQGRAAYGRQGQGASQQNIEHVLLPACPLKVSRKGG